MRAKCFMHSYKSKIIKIKLPKHYLHSFKDLILKTNGKSCFNHKIILNRIQLINTNQI